MTLQSETAIQISADIAYMQMLRRDCQDSGIQRVLDYFIREAKQRLEAEEQATSERRL
jgi:hypothetical protein